MKPMTQLMVKWHLGISNGKRRYEKEITIY